MNREIKFRGKSKKDGKWLYGYLGESKVRILNTEYLEKVIFNNVLSFNSDNYPFIVKDISVDPNTVGQYTGLKDKNGKEIYEGDIVKTPLLDPIFGDILADAWCNALIRFNQGSFVVSYYNSHNIYLQDLCDKIEILGKIHDNPELLKSE